jgi:hypothetical protein
VVPRDKNYIISIIQKYDWPVEEALLIAKCESNIRAEAIGDSGNSIGVFQINKVHFWRASRQGLLKPEVNVRIAYKIWSEQGWYPWTCAKKLKIK